MMQLRVLGVVARGLSLIVSDRWEEDEAEVTQRTQTKKSALADY